MMKNRSNGKGKIERCDVNFLKPITIWPPQIPCGTITLPQNSLYLSLKAQKSCYKNDYLVNIYALTKKSPDEKIGIVFLPTYYEIDFDKFEHINFLDTIMIEETEWHVFQCPVEDLKKFGGYKLE